MAVTIVSNITVMHDADDSGSWNGTSDTLYAGFQREGSWCLGDQVGNGWIDAYLSFTATPNFIDRTVFAWMRSGNPHSEAGHGFGISYGDGTEQVSYTVGGSDNWGHFVLGWGGFRIDQANLPSGSRQLTGTGAPDWDNITDCGVSMGYNSKANGNADNIFWDMFAWINNGDKALSISGGTGGTPSTFADMVTEDISTDALKAWGIIRELVGAKAYELFYGVEWGHATGSTYFDDSDFQLFINGGGSGDGGMSAGNMDNALLAGSGTNLFKWDNFVCVNTGMVADWDFSALFETFTLSNGQFVDGGEFLFPVTGGTLREVTFVSWTNCGIVDPSTMTFTDNSFIGGTNADGALLLDLNTIDMLRLGFTSDGAGHAVHITATGAYDITDCDFSGYSEADPGSNPTESTGSTDAVFYNESGGTVTLNMSGGSGVITVRNGAGADTIVNQNVSVTFDEMRDDSEVRIYAAGTKTELAGIEDAIGGSPDDRSFAASIAAGTSVDYTIVNTDYEIIRIETFTWPSAPQTILIKQRFDRNYLNN